jgi:hypothetical protein
MDDEIVPARSLPRAKRNLAHKPIPLVEEAEHRDALRHRGYTGFIALKDRAAGGLLLPGLLRALLAVAASRKCGSERKDQRRAAHRAYSGVQGW